MSSFLTQIDVEQFSAANFGFSVFRTTLAVQYGLLLFNTKRLGFFPFIKLQTSLSFFVCQGIV